MQNEKKYFLSSDSLLDADSADFVVSQNAWVNMQNARTGTTDKGVIGTVESIGSTKLISSPQPSVVFIAIGTADDVENKRFVTFYYNKYDSTNHKIECCYTDSDTIYTVLKSSQVTGGLNFTSEPIHSARITNGMLSWVNGTNNEPRKINIESGIVANHPLFPTTAQPYSFPLNFSEITMIKPPPIYTPNIQKAYDSLFLNNLIQYNSFEFSFQYQYYDSETTVVGAYSPASKLNASGQSFNYIRVGMDGAERIPNTVKIVRLICRISDGTSQGGSDAVVIKTWDKSITSEAAEITAQNNNTPLSYNFYNNITGENIAQDDVLRPFDNVPIYSQTHEIAKNRYFLANNTEGYTTPGVTSLTAAMTNIQTIDQSSQQYQYYLFQWATGAISQYLVSERWGFKGYFINGTIGGNTGWFLLNSYYNIDGAGNLPATPSAITTPIAVSGISFAGRTFAQVFEYIRNTYTTGRAQFSVILFQYPYTNSLIGVVNITGIVSTPYQVFPQRSTYKFGVVFYDYAMRKCGVVPRTITGNQLMYSFTTLVSATALLPNVINFSSNITQYMNPGDSITITGSTMAGTYVISAILGTTKVSVTTSVPVTSPTSATVDIYKYSTQDLTTPQRNYPYTNAVAGIKCTLSNSNAAVEIPDWAYYYSIVRTLNLRTRFFIQGLDNSTRYVTRNSTGEYNFDNFTFNTFSTVGIGVNTSSLVNAGLGYQYQEGDTCILIKDDSTTFTIPVIGQDGNYIILKAQDIGALNTPVHNFVFEVYSPYQASLQEPYYEMGEIFPIQNPGTGSRAYTILNYIFNGDTYVFSRNFANVTYNANAMSPNDLFWRRWDTDAGKTNFITKIGQQEKTTSISWSDTYVAGTQINGTSTFRALNETTVPQDCGSISKLQLTSKIQAEGTVMLSICTNETNSMYLGETQITDSTGAVQFFTANSSQIISTINTLKGSFGTINPEAVTEFRGSVYFCDANRGVWVQYSSNGLFPISSYKMTRFWKLFFQRYLSPEGRAEMTANNIRPYIFTTVDASHLELLISIPQVYQVPPKGYLPDYPSDVYPFDIYDGKGKTIVFCLENTGVQPHWQGSYSFNPEEFMCIQNKLYSIYNGALYLHNQTSTYNNFYGVQYPSRIMVVSNQNPQRPKVYNNVTVEANMKPSFTYFYNDYPYLQTSDLEDIDYRDFEGVFYAPLYRNKIVPTSTGYNTDGLLTWEKLRNVAMKIMFEFDVSNVPLELKFVNIGYQISRGHKT